MHIVVPIAVIKKWGPNNIVRANKKMCHTKIFNNKGTGRKDQRNTKDLRQIEHKKQNSKIQLF